MLKYSAGTTKRQSINELRRQGGSAVKKINLLDNFKFKNLGYA